VNKVSGPTREIPFLKNLFHYKGIHVAEWSPHWFHYPAQYTSPKLRAPIVGAPYIVEFLQLKCPEPRLFDSVDAHLHVSQKRYLHTLMTTQAMDSTIDSEVLRWRSPFACGSKFTALDLWCAPLSRDLDYQQLVRGHIESTRNALGIWHEYVV
jgi:hypothetical protein